MRVPAVVAILAVCVVSVSAGAGYYASFLPNKLSFGAVANRVLFGGPAGAAGVSNRIFLPFQFQFFGVTLMAGVRVSPNGWLSLDANLPPDTTDYPHSIPSAQFQSFISFWTTALDMNTSIASLRWGVIPVSDSGDRALVIRMEQITYAGCSVPADPNDPFAHTLNITVALYEIGGRIDINFDRITPPCDQAVDSLLTIGAQPLLPSYGPPTIWANHILNDPSVAATYSGRTLSLVLATPCIPNPCVNGGTCELAPTVPGGFLCQCAPLYNGRTCQLTNVYSLQPIPFAPAVSVNPTAISLSDDQLSAPISLPAAFWYFGVQYDSIVINSNGWISFDAAGTVAVRFPSTLPAAGYSSVLAAWCLDLNPNGRPLITYESSPDNSVFVIRFNRVPYFQYSSIRVTFQIKLFFSNYSIEIHYADVPQPDTAADPLTVGISTPKSAISALAQNYISTAPPLVNMSGTAIQYRVALNGVNVCGLLPCLNGGTCVPFPPVNPLVPTAPLYGVQCVCAEGFIGVQCEFASPNPCDPPPCDNGDCYRMDSLLRNASSSVNGDHYCACPQDFTGSTCAYSAKGSTGTDVPLYLVQEIGYAPLPLDSLATSVAVGTAACTFVSFLPAGSTDPAFQFQFFRVSATGFWYCPNGFLTFDAVSTSAPAPVINFPLPNPAKLNVKNFVAFWSAAFDTSAAAATSAGTSVQFEMFGQSPVRSFVLSVNALPLAACPVSSPAVNCYLSAQLIFREGDSTIEIHYGSTPTNQSSSAVVGIAGPAGAKTSVYRFNYGDTHGASPFNFGNSSISFSPVTSPCDLSPCYNGGTCTSTPGAAAGAFAYSCACPKAFAGANCEVATLSGYSVDSPLTIAYRALQSATLTAPVAVAFDSITGLSSPVSIGFGFRFFGVTYGAVRLCHSGYLIFDSSLMSCDTLTALPASGAIGTVPIVAYWGMPLALALAAGSVTYQLSTAAAATAGYRTFTVTLTGVPYASTAPAALSAPVSLHVVLYEIDSSIEMHYLSAPLAVDAIIPAPIVGLQNGDGSAIRTALSIAAVTHSVLPGGYTNIALRWTIDTPQFAPPPPPPPPSTSGLSGGEIFIIVVCVIGGVALLGCVLYRYRVTQLAPSRRTLNQMAATHALSSSDDPSAIYRPLNDNPQPAVKSVAAAAAAPSGSASSASSVAITLNEYQPPTASAVSTV